MPRLWGTVDHSGSEMLQDYMWMTEASGQQSLAQQMWMIDKVIASGIDKEVGNVTSAGHGAQWITLYYSNQ